MRKEKPWAFYYKNGKRIEFYPKKLEEFAQEHSITPDEEARVRYIHTHMRMIIGNCKNKYAIAYAKMILRHNMHGVCMDAHAKGVLELIQYWRGDLAKQVKVNLRYALGGESKIR